VIVDCGRRSESGGLRWPSLRWAPKPNPLVQSITPDLKTTRKAYIAADPQTLRNSKREVFAGGDIVTGSATFILAMGSSRKAPASVDECLKSGQWESVANYRSDMTGFRAVQRSLARAREAFPATFDGFLLGAPPAKCFLRPSQHSRVTKKVSLAA
jgi:hypothetical protein